MYLQALKGNGERSGSNPREKLVAKANNANGQLGIPQFKMNLNTYIQSDSINTCVFDTLDFVII